MAQDLLEPYVAKAALPLVQKLAGAQEAANLQRYNERFDSFRQMASALERLDGRGNSPEMAAQVEKLVHPNQPFVVEGPQWGGIKADDYFGIAAKLRKDAGL